MHSFYSHGKLLITGEYLVLDGASALALPTKRGQSLKVTSLDTSTLLWKSILHNGSLWFETEVSLPLDNNITSTDPVIQKLYEILIAAQLLNPNFLKESQGLEAISTLEFPRNWGLGSSSTLITNIAQWAKVNPYELLENTFGGSGYDIACATTESPITYIRQGTNPIIDTVAFYPTFKEQLFFIHLNKKQNSRDSIAHYRALDSSERKTHIKTFTNITKRIVIAQDSLSDFEDLITVHESQLSKIIQTPTIKKQLFDDYPHAIKSLGGWGGDFILVTGLKEDMIYFKERGFHTIIPYQEMVL